jgi:hypothetical protein
VEWVYNIVLVKRKIWTGKLIYIAPRTRLQIVNAKHAPPYGQEPLAQMRSQESRAASDNSNLFKL